MFKSFDFARPSLGAVALALAVMSFAPGLFAEERIELGLHLEPGQTYTQELLIDQEIAQVMFGQTIPMDQVIGMRMKNVVTDRPSEVGGRWLTLSYDRVWFKQDSVAGNVDFDSADPPEFVPPAARGFAGLAGQELQIEFAPDGDISQIEGVDRLIANVLEAMDMPDGPAREAAVAAVRSQLNEDNLSQMMQMSSALFPPGPVSRGDSWDDTSSIGGMMPMTVDSRITLTDFDDDTAELAVTGAIGPNADAGPFVMGETEIDAELTGTQSGTTVLDRATGVARSTTMQQEMAGGMTILAAEGREFDIEMTIKGRITLTTIDPAPGAAPGAAPASQEQ